MLSGGNQRSRRPSHKPVGCPQYTGRARKRLYPGKTSTSAVFVFHPYSLLLITTSVPSGEVQSEGHSSTDPAPSIGRAGGRTSPCNRAKRSRPVASGAGIELQKFPQFLPVPARLLILTGEVPVRDPLPSVFRSSSGLDRTPGCPHHNSAPALQNSRPRRCSWSAYRRRISVAILSNMIAVFRK